MEQPSALIKNEPAFYGVASVQTELHTYIVRTYLY